VEKTDTWKLENFHAIGWPFSGDRMARKERLSVQVREKREKHFEGKIVMGSKEH
jgi:hypothetical protein